MESFENERKLRIKQIKINENYLKDFYKFLIQSCDIKSVSSIKYTIGFAQKLKYNHDGLSDSAYFAHPLRVASLALKYNKPFNLDLVKLCILHNIYELCYVESEEVKCNFGIEIDKYISILTVDRKLQWEKSYKEIYYSKIINSGKIPSVVKVLDKLDNIYLIGNNPSEKIRKLYIKEIYEYIIPMANKQIPILEKTLIEACKIAEINGFNPIK